MSKKIVLKTAKNSGDVSAFIGGIKDVERRKDTEKVLAIMKRVTKKSPAMWGDSIVGFGSYVYHRSNGDEGIFFATGLSPRKSALTIYIMPGYAEYGTLLKRLGPHKKGASCLYIKHLKDIDIKVLEVLIERGFRDLRRTHKVS